MKLKIAVIAVLLTSASLSFGQKKSNWENFNWLIGEWIGEGSGQPGKGSGTFSFSYDLDSNIIVRKSHSEYPATESKSAFIHDDLMVVYSDSDSNPVNAIYFDNEGHIINYQITYSNNSLVFTSSKIPNVPIFRLTYSLIESDVINTKFEMSRDGETFMTYIEGKSKKLK